MKSASCIFINCCLFNTINNGEDEDTCEYPGQWTVDTCTANGQDVTEHRPLPELCEKVGDNTYGANGTWTSVGECSDPAAGEPLDWRLYDFQCGPGAAGEKR